MLTLLISILIPICLVLVFRFINKAHKPPLFGIYQQQNKYYWFKFVFMYVVLSVRQLIWRLRRAYAVDAGRSGDGTIEVHVEDSLLEQKHDLGHYPLAGDAIFFNGVSKDGNAITFALNHRQGNVCDALAFIKLNGVEYLSPKLPDSYLEQNESKKGEFSVQGIQIEYFIPMRTWKLSYNGKMKVKSDPERTVNVQADLTWSALFASFNYDYQLSPRGLADAIAREPWSSDYFRTIQKFHQTHYEQMGSLKGTINIDGEEHIVKMPSFRDRTFGKIRDWRNFHRFVIHLLYLENGDCIVVTSISQPLVVSHFTTGFMSRKSDQAVMAVQSCDFKLFHHGENQATPKDYGFSFKAGGKRYTVQVAADDGYVWYVGKHREAKVFEHWLKVEINGVKGRGYTQWMYNNVQASNSYK